MNASHASVSVVIPTYNRAGYLTTAIDSVLAQTYRSLEIIVVDDGSTDDTEDLVGREYGDRVTYLWQRNQGESVARNKGVGMATGEYVAFLDSDDVWSSDKLEKQMDGLKRFPDADLVFSPAWVVDANGQRVPRSPLSSGLHAKDLTIERLLIGNIIWPSMLVVRRELLDAVGGFNSKIKYGEDWDLILRLALYGVKVLYLPEPLASIRRHGDSQCHYPNAKHADRLLSDHIHILEGCFCSFPDRTPPSFRARCIANQYAQASLAFLATGHPEKSKDLLRMGVETDRSFFSTSSPYCQYVVNYAFDYVREQGTRPNSEVVTRFVEATLGQLDHYQLDVAQLERKIWSTVGITLAYDARNQGDIRQVRAWLVRAIRLDWHWLSNMGVLGLMCEALCGRGLAGALRTAVRGAKHARRNATILVDTRSHS